MTDRDIRPYEVDDRGNIVQFYDTETDDIVAELNREDNRDECGSSLSWWGNSSVTAWAMANGYGTEISQAHRV